MWSEVTKFDIRVSVCVWKRNLEIAPNAACPFWRVAYLTTDSVLPNRRLICASQIESLASAGRFNIEG